MKFNDIYIQEKKEEHVINRKDYWQKEKMGKQPLLFMDIWGQGDELQKYLIKTIWHLCVKISTSTAIIRLSSVKII